MKEYVFTRSRTSVHIMSDSVVADSEEEAIKAKNKILNGFDDYDRNHYKQLTIEKITTVK